MIKILLVEDEPDILEVVKLALELYGEFEVVDCSSGEEALRVVGDRKPDVFLLDFMMPGMSGPQLLARFREVPGLEDVPAIFLTARTGAGTKSELLELGAKEVIYKPFKPTTLGAQVKTAMGR
ncbi:response regulator [Sulfitobacter dubius]|uniref:response regulator n=1 Tax=Sulfitobacter dubius TaxID=218673 RepID=UPI002942DF23|nr:response regulator [Sulfitobacter dubius]WOI30768.1 response regulator [Sulfitobacter dubius]